MLVVLYTPNFNGLKSSALIFMQAKLQTSLKKLRPIQAKQPRKPLLSYHMFSITHQFPLTNRLIKIQSCFAFQYGVKMESKNRKVVPKRKRVKRKELSTSKPMRHTGGGGGRLVVGDRFGAKNLSTYFLSTAKGRQMLTLSLLP